MTNDLETLRDCVHKTREAFEAADVLRDEARVAYHKAVADLQRYKFGTTALSRGSVDAEPIDRMAQLRSNDQAALRSYETERENV